MKKILLLLIVSAAVVECRAEIPPAEKLLPKDTLGVVSVPDVNKAREVYARAPMTQLWDDPAMKPFREKFMDKFRSEWVKPLERDLGTSLTNYYSLLQGQLTLAYVQNGWEGGKD